MGAQSGLSVLLEAPCKAVQIGSQDTGLQELLPISSFVKQIVTPLETSTCLSLLFQVRNHPILCYRLCYHQAVLHGLLWSISGNGTDGVMRPLINNAPSAQEWVRRKCSPLPAPQLSVGAQFCMALLHFCTSCEQKQRPPSFWILFPSMFAK